MAKPTNLPPPQPSSSPLEGTSPIDNTHDDVLVVKQQTPPAQQLSTSSQLTPSPSIVPPSPTSVHAQDQPFLDDSSPKLPPFQIDTSSPPIPTLSHFKLPPPYFPVVDSSSCIRKRKGFYIPEGPLYQCYKQLRPNIPYPKDNCTGIQFTTWCLTVSDPWLGCNPVLKEQFTTLFTQNGFGVPDKSIQDVKMLVPSSVKEYQAFTFVVPRSQAHSTRTTHDALVSS